MRGTGITGLNPTTNHCTYLGSKKDSWYYSCIGWTRLITMSNCRLVGFKDQFMARGTRAFAILLLVLPFFLLCTATLWAQAQSVEITSEPGASYPPNGGNCPSCQECGQTCCGSCGGCFPHCPSGFTDYFNRCVPACPPGYRRYPGFAGLCLPPCHHGCPDGFEPVPLPQCPPGYHRDLTNIELCISDFSDDRPRPVCELGMEFDPGQGRCIPSCPEGTYAGDDGLCVSIYLRECPAGYVRNQRTGACVPPGTWPPDYTWLCLPVCPPGYFRDLREPTRCIPPPPNCPEGYELREGRCLPQCPPGLERDRYGYCPPPQECPPGSYPDARGNCHPGNYCPYGFERVNGRCLPFCPPGTLRSTAAPTQCQEQPTCPQGYETFRNTCAPICPPGTSRNLQDPMECNPPPGQTPHCEPGFTYNPNSNRCEPPPQRCKTGFVYNLRTKRCELPPRQCPSGYIRDQQTGQCIRKRGSNLPSCPQGFGFNPETGECEPRGRTGNDCPPGMIYSRQRQGCVRLNTLQPIYPIEPMQPKPSIMVPPAFNPNLKSQ